MVCYKRECEGEVNTLTPLFESTGIKTDRKMVGKKEGASYLHSVAYSLLNERNLGQSSGVTWRGGGRGKCGWLVHRLFVPKRPTCVREIWRRILVWIKPTLEVDHWGQPALGSHTPVKRRERNLNSKNPSKITTTQTLFLLHLLTIGKLYVFNERETVKVLFHR